MTNTIIVPLPAIPAVASVNAALPAELADGLAAYWPWILDAPDWTARATVFDAMMAGLADDPGRHLPATQGIVTALLEQVAEREIATRPAALLYRCSNHDGWRRAARRFLAATDAAAIERAMRVYPGIALLALRTISAEAVR